MKFTAVRAVGDGRVLLRADGAGRGDFTAVKDVRVVAEVGLVATEDCAASGDFAGTAVFGLGSTAEVAVEPVRADATL